jgi:hypothetical protein
LGSSFNEPARERRLELGKNIKLETKERRGFDSRTRKPDRIEIRPDVQTLVDKVIVPILVREFLDVLRSEKQLAIPAHHVSGYAVLKANPANGKVAI